MITTGLPSYIIKNTRRYLYIPTKFTTHLCSHQNVLSLRSRNGKRRGDEVWFYIGLWLPNPLEHHFRTCQGLGSHSCLAMDTWCDHCFNHSGKISVAKPHKGVKDRYSYCCKVFTYCSARNIHHLQHIAQCSSANGHTCMLGKKQLALVLINK